MYAYFCLSCESCIYLGNTHVSCCSPIKIIIIVNCRDSLQSRDVAYSLEVSIGEWPSNVQKVRDCNAIEFVVYVCFLHACKLENKTRKITFTICRNLLSFTTKKKTSPHNRYMMNICFRSEAKVLERDW